MARFFAKPSIPFSVSEKKESCGWVKNSSSSPFETKKKSGHLLSNDAPPLSKMATVQEVASRLNIDARTVRNLAANGEIPAVRIGKQWRFERKAIEEKFNITF